MSLSQARVRELLDYNPKTGDLTWRVDRVNGVGRINCAAGTVAGCVTADRRTSYRQIKIDGRKYKAHRLAWLYVIGSWPARGIDHKDGDGLNNRWRNLREATRSQNGANRRLNRNNTSGVKGVSWRTDLGKWQTDIRVAGKRHYLGSFSTLEAAAAAYEAAAIKHFGEFARP